MQIIIAVFIFVLTIIFRKYLYIAIVSAENPILYRRDEKKDTFKENASSNTQKNSEKFEKTQKIEPQQSGGIKIYIDKEIQ